MIRESVDVLVIGAGFAGSLTALLMRRIGRSVVLVDRGRHPRFAIGESSTPLADLTLRGLAERYDLPRILPLCQYGTWKPAYPGITCGQKRGFSYFRHTPGEHFEADDHHSRELLVTASRSRENADTHWLRSDVDAFFAREAAGSGVLVIEKCDLQPVGRDPWRWRGEADGEAVEIQTRLVVDGSGPAGVVAQAAGIPLQDDREFQTRSSCLYAHVSGLQPWHDVLKSRGVDCSDYPFRADVAAVHHLLDEGWMWQLPFDNGVTSVGLVRDSDALPTDGDAFWQRTLDRYPTLAGQFRSARIVAPGDRPVSSSRLQRRWKKTAGRDWVLLPATAGFIDPLHSTGIAHSLFGIERLVDLADRCWGTDAFTEGLNNDSTRLSREFELIDHLVAACYATRSNFEIFAAATMLYFTAAIHCEERRLAGECPGFLSLDDDALRESLLQGARRLIRLRNKALTEPETVADEVRTLIAPWNTAGLLSSPVPNMYHYTGH